MQQLEQVTEFAHTLSLDGVLGRNDPVEARELLRCQLDPLGAAAAATLAGEREPAHACRDEVRIDCRDLLVPHRTQVGRRGGRRLPGAGRAPDPENVVEQG